MEQAIALSAYHQQKVESAQSHLSSGNVSEARLPAALKDELADIWSKPVLFSTFRHPRLDAIADSLSGDTVFDAIAERVGIDVDVTNIFWESHPRGLGTIYFSYPSLEGVTSLQLAEPLANFTQWRPAQTVRTDLEQLLSANNWSALIQQVNLLPKVDRELFTDTVNKVRLAYNKAISSIGGQTLTQFAWEVEEGMTRELVGQLPVVKPRPYIGSHLESLINRSLMAVDQALGLERLLSQIVDEKTAANLFVGGSIDRAVRIGFSVKKNQFQMTEYDIRNPKNKYNDRKVITKGEVFDRLESADVLAAGPTTFLSLVAASCVVPIAHLGNEYEEADKAGRALGLDQTAGYLQITDDNRNCWAPIRARDVAGQPIRLTMSTMYLWSKLLGVNWVEWYKRSIRQGHPIDILVTAQEGAKTDVSI